MIDRRSRSAAETRAPAPAAALARALVLVLALAAPPLEAAPNAVAAAPDAAAIVARAESIMYPDAKGEATLYFRDEKGRSETYRMVYYAKERNQKMIVRFLEPALARGNDLLMIEKSVW
ncbi:MAG: hypothetical protein Q8M76_06085, partial [Spirochaetaceae bacterium]|nr:hypothetical protein [Spirochaetaceae bacterium]